MTTHHYFKSTSMWLAIAFTTTFSIFIIRLLWVSRETLLRSSIYSQLGILAIALFLIALSIILSHGLTYTVIADSEGLTSRSFLQPTKTIRWRDMQKLDVTDDDGTPFIQVKSANGQIYFSSGISDYNLLMSTIESHVQRNQQQIETEIDQKRRNLIQDLRECRTIHRNQPATLLMSLDLRSSPVSALEALSYDQLMSILPELFELSPSIDDLSWYLAVTLERSVKDEANFASLLAPIYGNKAAYLVSQLAQTEISRCFPEG